MAENKTMFIGVAQIQQDWGISRSKAQEEESRSSRSIRKSKSFLV